MSEAILPGNLPIGEDQTTRQTERRRLWGAAALSGFVHALILALLIGLWNPQPDETQPPPIPVTVTRDDTGASGAAGGGNGDTAASTQADSSDNTAPAFATAQATAAPPPQPTQEDVSPPRTPAPASVAPAVLPDLPTTTHEALAAVPPRKPAPPHQTKSAAAAKPQAETPPQPSQPPVPTPSVADATPTPAAPASESPASGDAQTEAGDGGRGRGAEGTGLAAVGDGALSGKSDDYLAKVRLWILRFKKAPDDDCTMKQGKGSFGITIARDGRLLNVWLEQSSGCPLTDAAALQMARAASPVPPLPSYVAGDAKDVQMPFDFRIGFLGRMFH